MTKNDFFEKMDDIKKAYKEFCKEKCKNKNEKVRALSKALNKQKITNEMFDNLVQYCEKEIQRIERKKSKNPFTIFGKYVCNVVIPIFIAIMGIEIFKLPIFIFLFGGGALYVAIYVAFSHFYNKDLDMFDNISYYLG